MIVINGINMPFPSAFRLPRFDIDSSDTMRNELGVLQRDRIRQGIYKIELEYRGITSEQLQAIEAAIEPAALQVEFPSPQGAITATMYAGDRAVEMVKYNDDYNKIRWNLAFNLIEY